MLLRGRYLTRSCSNEQVRSIGAKCNGLSHDDHSESRPLQSASSRVTTKTMESLWRLLDIPILISRGIFYQPGRTRSKNPAGFNRPFRFTQYTDHTKTKTEDI